MVVKYFCPQCGRTFAEWGVKKLEFKCPTENCEQVTPLLLTTNEMENRQKPKSAKKRKSILPISNPEKDEFNSDDFVDDATIELPDDDKEGEDMEEDAEEK